MYGQSGSNSETRQHVEVSSRGLERSSEESSRALSRISKGIQQGLVNKALVLGLLMLVAESLLITHFQPGAALALLRDTPPLAVLTGTLANVTPLLVPLVGFAICAFGILQLPGLYYREGINQIAFGTLVLLAALIFVDRNLVSPWLLVALVLIVLISAWMGLRISRNGAAEESIDSVRQLLKFLVVALVSGIILTNPSVRDHLQRPYLPPEEIRISDGSSEHETAGYVLNSDGNSKWTTFLDESTRSVHIVKTDTIKNRRICSLEDRPGYEPWWGIFITAQKNSIPQCR
ncbi:hypothetical protein [Brevibacterium picturae]|uniref:hypothetical protein n=1 Tax=Brevibacterium picturae TaxID=260553 RepID=UPI0031F752E6